MYDNIKCLPYVCILINPRRRERSRQKKSFRSNGREFSKIDEGHQPIIQEALLIFIKINKKKSTHRNMMVKMQKTKVKEKIS